jgi:murein DD-endopeptidase MepM/ murein hydrolase activator NlpD
MMGYCMAIKHDGDAYTIYKNLGAELPEGIEVGADVRSGQLIASVGDSAMEEIAQEPHLHFEITVGGLQVDPIEHLGKEAISVLSPNLEETKS